MIKKEKNRKEKKIYYSSTIEYYVDKI